MKKLTCLIALSLVAMGPAVWAIPSQITYQGTLKEKGSPANSPPNYAMTFQLTDQSGNKPYSNVISNPVTVTNGLFSVQLSFQLIPPNTWDTISPYLKVTINGQALSPTEPVAATAYAIVSNSVVDGAITPAKVTNGYGLVPSGSIMAYAGATPPAGWLSCDGSAVSRSTYASLFAAIGITWGNGDGASTFNLPDLRGRAPIGTGQGAGLTNRLLGAITGQETHVLTTEEMPSHSHGTTPTTATVGTGTSIIAGASPGTYLPAANAQNLIIQNTGGNLAHNIMQPSIVVNYIIKM